jgi:hypothetical protein
MVGAGFGINTYRKVNAPNEAEKLGYRKKRNNPCEKMQKLPE